MIKDMFSVMERINEIKERFGIKKYPPRALLNAAGESYKKIHDKAINEELRGTDTPGFRNEKNYTVEDINKMADFYAGRYRVPGSLVRAVIKEESGYNTRAVSPRGAMGLMQLMPTMVKELGVKNPFSPEENIRAGTELLSRLMAEYNSDYKLALSAYNAGKGAVEKHGGIPDFKETKEYVKKVIDSYLANQ